MQYNYDVAAQNKLYLTSFFSPNKTDSPVFMLNILNKNLEIQTLGIFYAKNENFGEQNAFPPNFWSNRRNVYKNNKQKGLYNFDYVYIE